MPDPVPLEWTPPALAQLSLQAPVKISFTLDRTMLGAAAGLVPDTDAPTRQAINKLDGVSVHLLRFGRGGHSRRERGRGNSRGLSSARLEAPGDHVRHTAARCTTEPPMSGWCWTA